MIASHLHYILAPQKPLNGRVKGFRAFTLIELLVVIAIIAILAALLSPALNRAKNQSAQTTDLNNLHQVSVALHVYAADDKDSLTPPNWDYGHAMPDGTARAGWLYKPDLSATGTNIFKAPTGLLWDSLRDGKIFLCPMDQPGQVYTNNEQRAQQLSSYIMNGAVNGFRSGFKSNAPPVKMSRMLPGDCLFWEADEREAFSFNDGSSWPVEPITRRHANGAAQAALDGSANHVRWDDWQNDLAVTTKNRLWCFPDTPDGGDLVYGHDK